MLSAKTPKNVSFFCYVEVKNSGYCTFGNIVTRYLIVITLLKVAKNINKLSSQFSLKGVLLSYTLVQYPYIISLF